jgi:transposase
MSLEERLMGHQRYSKEFKAEAVRQVIERGYPVSDVAARVGVSAHSLYKWTRAARPTKTERQSSDLDTAKAEIARLKADLRRAEEERDILKKAAAYFANERR